MANSNITFPMRPMKVCPTDCGIAPFVFPVLGAVGYVCLIFLWFMEVYFWRGVFGVEFRASYTTPLSLIFLLLLLSFGLFLVWFFKWITEPLRTRRAIVRALTNQILRQTLLRLDIRTYGLWAVSTLTPGGAGKSCIWLTTNTPIFMDPSQNLVLGVTTGDGTMCMPLDTTLKWIGLTDRERAQMRNQIGPERLRIIPLPCDFDP